MEQELIFKVEELMLSLDSTKEYKEIAKAMVDSSLILLSVILTILAAALIFNLFELSGYINTFNILSPVIPYSITFYLLLSIIPIGVFVGSRRASRRKSNDWREVLKEGPTGAIKLLTELDWKTVFEDLRIMKLAMIARVIGGIILYYLFIQFLFGFIAYAISILIFQSSFIDILFAYFDLYESALYLMPIPIAIFISKSDLRKYYQKLGSIDYLLWSLRWLYNEFKGMKFEA
ncbi:MAG: hypothetical protein QXU09_02045 [Thermoproteota archaeon]|nr:hypothetical protein [Candidatus Brockarchaeota archaeon]